MNVILKFYTLSLMLIIYRAVAVSWPIQCNKAITCKSEVMDEWDILIQLNQKLLPYKLRNCEF